MPGLCEGRVVAVTGAGRGVGKEHALLFAKEGAKVVVNDLGDVADEVVNEIRAMGGEAVANKDDCSTWEGGNNLIKQCIDAFGGLDTLVNNAGILRDKTLINMKEEEWDAVVKVHLKGTFVPTKAACQYWRQCAKDGKPRKGRIVNTASTSGLYGNYGQSNYGAAKAGIAALTVILNAEMARFDVKVNCIAPNARTRMTEGLGFFNEPKAGDFDPFHARVNAPPVVWFGSDACNVGGAVLLIAGTTISVMENWSLGQSAEKADAPWDVNELTEVIPRLVAGSKEHPMYVNMKAAIAAAAASKAKKTKSKL